MLKGLVTWFLNNYLGKYLEDLNTDQLSIALLQGEVELENVPLRRDALRFVDKSLDVKNGFVGRVKLKIPVSRLRSEPWSIILEKVYVVVTPQCHGDYDELEDDSITQEIKLASLEGIESEWRASHDIEHADTYYPSYTAWMSFGTSFIGTIVENLQVQICDVHIRYEDKSCLPSQELFACGFSLDSLSAQSCDQNWIPKFVHREPGDNMSFKIVELQNMSVYINVGGESFSDLPRDELLSKMSTCSRGNVQGIDYIIGPLSANAMLRRNCTEKPLNSKKHPRLSCDIDLKEVEVKISDQQYQSSVLAGRTLHQLHKNRKFWRWRPLGSLKGNAKAWWQYAIACHMEEIHERNINATWESALCKARENVQYVAAFQSYLKNPVILEPELKDLKASVDANRSYTELRILREQAVALLDQEMSINEMQQQCMGKNQDGDDGNDAAAAQSRLQGWFPMWLGWYASPADPEQAVASTPLNESSIEDELMEALADDATGLVPYKDVIFMQSSFNLDKCVVKLESRSKGNKSKLLFDVEFSKTKLEVETRPRTQSNKIMLSLDALFIRDHVTPDTVFPTLISPICQPKRNASGLASSFGQFARTLQSYMTYANKTEGKTQIGGPLFHLLYEKKPFQAPKVDYRLHIKSQPLSIVYNPVVMACLRNYFRIPDDINRSTQLSQRLREAAFHRIEEVKERTRQNVNDWLDDSHLLMKKNLDLVLDLSAPQVIIPEHFADKEAALLILDFGKFHLDNGWSTPSSMATTNPDPPKSPSSFNWPSTAAASSSSNLEASDDDDDDEFVTPASSPTSPIKSPAPALGDAKSPKTEDDVSQRLRQKIYENYSIQLCDMQVIVGRLKDNWRHAQLKGTSTLHVLDKFSISLQIDRRLVASNDGHLPKFAISGTLPRLSMHVNEDKVHAVERIVQLFSQDELGQSKKPTASDHSTQTLFTGMTVPRHAIAQDDNDEEGFHLGSAGIGSVDDGAILLLVYFCISEMSVEIQSLGKSIVELQVTGVKASLTRRAHDISLGLSVHSLLLVDAIQTLGPNFELLAASHRSVTVDSVSGSLRGSDPVSPASPSSPLPNVRHKPTSPSDIAMALAALQRTKEDIASKNESDFVDPDSLISIDVTYVEPRKDNEEQVLIVSIQFNSLDIIANQETIIELIYFARRIIPDSVQIANQRRRKFPTKEHGTQTEGDHQIASQSWHELAGAAFDIRQRDHHQGGKSSLKTEVTADFQRLNVLLLRAGSGRMVATALLTEARIHLQVSDSISASGSLGGLQVHNLLTGSQLHQRLISVGKDPGVEENRKMQGNIHSELYVSPKVASDSFNAEQEVRALSFSVTYCTRGGQAFKASAPATTPMQESGPSFELSHQLQVELRMASVCYLHSPAFIRELKSCATDFIHFLSQLASSITTAATDLALGIVQRRTESISRQAEMMDIMWQGGGASDKSMIFGDKYASLDRGTKIFAPAPTPSLTMASHGSWDVSVDAVCETPVIVVPRDERSHEVLVGHLGMITISNETVRSCLSDRTDKLNISIENMNIHSLDLLAQLRAHDQSTIQDGDVLRVISLAKGLPTLELYSCNSICALPILHDTEVSFCLERHTFSKHGSDLDYESLSSTTNSMETYAVQGQVINPLKVSLFRHQYGQILDTVSSLMQNRSDTTLAEDRHHSASTMSTPSKATTSSQETHVPITGNFSLPKLYFALCPEGSARKEIISMELEDFVVRFSKLKPTESSTEIALGSVVIEDLTLDEESPHRKLATSIKPSTSNRWHGKLASRSGLSLSCPHLNLHNLYTSDKTDGVNRCHSLPEELNVINKSRKEEAIKMRCGPVPATPPPSECQSDEKDRQTPFIPDESFVSDENLVSIKITNLSEGEKNHRDVDVDFNTLDIIFSLQSWVIILDFFGIGSPKAQDSFQRQVATSSTTSPTRKVEEGSSQKMVVKVRSLSVVLNHSNYEVARASVTTLLSQLNWTTDGNFAIEGSLRKFLVTDLTNHGDLYHERFLSMQGYNDVLTFHFFKYGDPQEASVQPFDASLRLRMASIIYVHTQRFYSELMAFFNHFHQHQNVMNRIRIATMGSDVSETASRGMRLQIDLEAGSPLLILPVASASSRLLVVNLGFLRVHNTFKQAGDAGTISSQTLRSALSSHLLQNRRRRRSSSRSSRRSRRSGFKSPSSVASSRRRSLNRRGGGVTSASDDEDEEAKDILSDLHPPTHGRCLLDVMDISLSSMDIRTALRLSAFTENLTEDDIIIGGFIVRQQSRKILKQTCELQLQVERNLDKAFNHQVPDLSINGSLSSVHATIDGEQYALIRGLLAYNLGENLDDLAQFNAPVPTNEYQDPEMQTLLSGLAWTCFYMNIGLQDVILDLKQESAKEALARVSFVRSVLTYESFSDGSRDVDLVSQDILLNDLRYSDLPMNKRPSVFPQILRPINHDNDGILQAEVHFRLTPETNRITILVNNMRLLGIFDWWLLLLDFVTITPEEPVAFKAKSEKRSHDEGPQSDKNLHFTSSEEPLYPSAGILSRRAPVVESKGPVFELKLNITDSDFIIIADPSVTDSTAVILRSTTVLAYRPDMIDRPFSCNLNNAEVFSCLLSNEEESALSIIDPVTINFEIAGRNVPGMPSKGLSDLLVEQEDSYNKLGTYERTAEIQLQQLNVRLSYHDWLVFQKIMNSFPRQANDALQQHRNLPVNVDHQLKQLMDLGFQRQDCSQALNVCQGHLEEAALWLTQNCSPLSNELNASSALTEESGNYFLEGSKISFTNFECKISTINVCIIDDCRDVDVPLVDLSLNRVHLHHDFERVGEASCYLTSSYYNRSLSSWEPLMEQWKCSLGWRVTQNQDNQKLVVSLETDETVNFNVTTTLLALYHNVKHDWSTLENSATSPTTYQALVRGCTRRRMPFTPFAIKNETGLTIWFRRLLKGAAGSSSATQWCQVIHGEETQFSFEGNRSVVGRGSNNILDGNAHQIIVVVEGWQESTPVTIDRVGTFFRKAIPNSPLEQSTSLQGEMLPPPIRVVFDVSIHGAALKRVTVRSALLVENKLPFAMELQLENTTVRPNEVNQVVLKPNEVYSVPLRHVWAKTTARPCPSKPGDLWKFSDKSIDWYHILSPKDNILSVHTSNHMWRSDIDPQRFCVAVRCQQYPRENASSNHRDTTWVQPAHTISFLPPIVIVNLLPCHLMFKFRGDVVAEDSVSPGKESFISADIEKNMTVQFSLDAFPISGDLVLQAGRHNFESRIELSDMEQRQLQLHARVESSHGGALRISIYARHWLVNKTGLPLVFRQEGASIDAAGQEDANETARMAAPLMFSFNDNLSETSSSQVTMRLGQGLHQDSSSQWCRSFPLQPGSRVRKLFVVPKDASRVSRIYIIGIDVRVGKGRYRDTLIVTMSPRFQIHNQTPFKIQISQKCFATTFHDLEAEATHLQAYPQSSFAFHWPRIDRDTLLCLRLFDETGAYTHWSGGVIIDRVDSFHVSLRHHTGRSMFIRVEVNVIAATYCTVLTDAANFPPPFRIDNFCEVPITCHQVDVQDESLKTVAKAHQSIPFAWDEPTFPPHVICSAPGGSSATYNMNVIGEGSQLTYENFIYITMSVTIDTEAPPLVFDVEGTKVFLAPKEAGKRSQLWRMTSGGMLQHEGSSPPQDPTQSLNEMMRNSLVLDIAGPAVQPQTYVPLMLRKPDERRQLTQKWRFTDDGRLMCSHRGLYVQAKDGFAGMRRGSSRVAVGASFSWRMWNDLVLGPPQPLVVERTMDTGVALEQAISRQRMRPGSGTLCVRVSTDGPTRVLQILDVNRPTTKAYATMDDHHLCSNVQPTTQLIRPETGSEKKCEREVQILFSAKGGVGFSLVSLEPPEELLYAFLSNVMIDYHDTAGQVTLDGSVQNVQIDNQLAYAQYPVVLFLSPATRHDEYRHLPAVTFNVQRMKTHHENAEIYKHLMVQVKNVTFNLEEDLLYKVFKFAGITRSDEEMEQMDETAYETQYALFNANRTAKRYYFGNLKVSLNQIRLSVTKSLKLPPELEAVRRKLGLSLIAFEDALIDLDPFIRVHPFETINFLTNAIVKHYTDELLSQAVLILGATDFLGNPIGFINDLSEGISGLVSEGDVGGLIKNVAHGAANSAAKVTGSLSYGISKATVYDKYNEKRLMLRRQRGDRSKEYLVDGLKGLGFGVFQGLTSIVTETYEGVATDGISGLFSGLTWGLIGTVSKPALGVLDLATGAATAVKESSRSRRKELPVRLRLPRLVRSAGGVLPSYSRTDSQGQQLLFRLNGHDNREIFIAHHLLRSGPEENLQLLISSSRILVFSSSPQGSSGARDKTVEGATGGGSQLRIMMDISHEQLVCARCLILPEDEDMDNKHYVELVGKMDDETSHKRPRVRCDTETLTRLVAQQINFALDMFEENQQAVIEAVAM